MNTKRFTPWIVFVCMGALAACTGGDDTAGNTELNVIVPADPSNTGTPSQIDIQDIEYTIDCQGNSDVFLDNAASFPDEVTLNGNLEVVDGRPAPPGSTLANSEIWQGFGDLPPGPCTVQLRAKDGDGEVICTATEPFSVAADSTTKVDIVLICDISFQAPVGRLDVDGTFSFNVGNFCPDLFVLNCLDSAPAEAQVLPPPAPPLAGTQCETRFRDGDSTCGQNCDPQTCTPTPEGLTCTPGPDPGVSTTVSCTNAFLDCTGTGAPTSSCTWSGDTLGTLGQGPAPFPGPPPAGTFFVTCIPPGLGGTPGATATCTAVTTDGDEDCDRVETFDITCPGLAPCDPGATPPPPDCTDTSGETHPACVAGVCDDTSGTAVCVFSPANELGSCDTNPSNSSGFNGRCESGVCVDFGCATNADCDQGDECNAPETCSAPTCVGGGPTNEGGACDAGTGANTGTCGTGTCVDNCAGVVCDDGNECTDDPACVSVGGPTCPPAVDDDTNTCTTCPSGTCACSAGSCIDDVGPGPPNYDLTTSIFKPYNSLLPALTGTGQPDTDCNAPDLTTAPGNNLTGINTQCLIILPPDVSGDMTFEETSAGVFDVTGVQDLLFTIDVTIPAVSARVIINTDSSTVFTGTATGSLPGTLTMDPLTAPFNINADATGIANCQALNQLFIGFACTVDTDCPFGGACPDPITTETPPCGQICDADTGCLPTDVSTQVCPLANLGPGDNTVPLPGDPGLRTFPPITVTDADFNLGDGAAAVNGWYLSNPAPMAGNGTQWVHLSGVRTNP